jgi:uncharacterized protein YunC (DUF1805 family)
MTTVVQLTPVPLDGGMAVGITVELPRTTLVIVAGTKGYIMCGALDVALLDSPRLAPRGIAAGRALGVRSVPELLAAPLDQVTAAARALGLREGMAGRDAARLLL